MNDLIYIAIGLSATSFILDQIMKSYGSKNRPKTYMAMDNLLDSKPIADLNKMNDKQFEIYVFEVFKKANWYPQYTPNKDDGVDVLATSPNGIRWAIECKCWLKPIGNHVVRSVNSGKQTYKCQKSLVVSAKSPFTEPARKQAQILKVILVEASNLENWVKNQL